jgi:hypothetical protein
MAGSNKVAALADPREEMPEPGGELAGVGSCHAQGLDQRRREELVAARLPRLTVAVGAEPMERAAADKLRQARVEPLRPFERQHEREGGVEVRTDADRVSQDREIVAEPLRERTRKRLERISPWFGVARRFQVKSEQPCLAVGPLETAAERPLEIAEFAGDLLLREAIRCQIGDRVALGDRREQPPHGQQRPPAVDAAMPVEAAVEDWVKLPRRQRIVVAEQHVVELVRIFLPHMTERYPRHVRSQVGVQCAHA